MRWVSRLLCRRGTQVEHAPFYRFDGRVARHYDDRDFKGLRRDGERRPVLRDVPTNAEILRTEIFGPVAPITTWSTDDELIKLVGASEFGLASYVHSNDWARSIRVAEGIDTGMVGINRGLLSDPSAPFGGTKQSGLGREGARSGLREFQETQYLSIDWPR